MIRKLDEGNMIISSGYYKGIDLVYVGPIDLTQTIKHYFAKNKYEFGVTIFTERMQNKLKADLNKILLTLPGNNKPYTQLARILHSFDCSFEYDGRKENKRIIIYKS